MSAFPRWRLLGALALVVVVAASIGVYLLASMPGTSPTVSPTVLTTAVQSSVTSTSVITTGSRSLTTTAFSSQPVEWIRISDVKPMGYYLSLLESNRTEAYVQLARELRRLPDLTNATAVAKITNLALNATNPEVKEAFELMMKGGTPDPRDFTYSVPRYNTELQVLYWLAEQSEFKKDDTLALAIAMVNGLWVTMGDQQVRDSVKKDTSGLLNFFRETNELQRRRNLPQLEAYPLEALICLSWVGSLNGIGGPHGVVHGSHAQKVNLELYLWDTPSLDTLRRMRDMIVEKHWLGEDVDSTVANVEEYFYFSGFEQHWNYTTETEEQIEVDGEKVKNWEIYNVDYYFRYYIETGKGRGDCGDETAFIDAWLKSWGIASNFVVHQRIIEGRFYGHAHIIYYEPASKTWKAYYQQASPRMYYNEPELIFYVFFFRPPVIQQGYFLRTEIKDSRMGIGGRVFMKQYSVESFGNAFHAGLPTAEMKRWLLYS